MTDSTTNRPSLDGIPDVRADLPTIPALVAIFNPHHPHAAPDVYHEGSTYSGVEKVADTLFHAMREGRFLVAPRGVLYLDQGAYDLTDVFSRMWDAPESVALREMAREERYAEPGRKRQKDADAFLHRTWAAFLWDHGVIE